MGSSSPSHTHTHFECSCRGWQQWTWQCQGKVPAGALGGFLLNGSRRPPVSALRVGKRSCGIDAPANIMLCCSCGRHLLWQPHPARCLDLPNGTCADDDAEPSVTFAVAAARCSARRLSTASDDLATAGDAPAVDVAGHTGDTPAAVFGGTAASIWDDSLVARSPRVGVAFSAAVRSAYPQQRTAACHSKCRRCHSRLAPSPPPRLLGSLSSDRFTHSNQCQSTAWVRDTVSESQR